jgi:hypothetical protein
MPCARIIKLAAGLLRTRFIPDDARWQAAQRGSQPVGLDQFLYLYLLYEATKAEKGQLVQVICAVHFLFHCWRKEKSDVGYIFSNLKRAPATT